MNNRMMNRSKFFTELLGSRCVRGLCLSFASLTDITNEIHAKKLASLAPPKEDGGGSELSDILDVIFKDQIAEMSDEKLHECLVHAHIAFVYFQATLDLVQNKEADNDKTQKQRQCHACIAATRSILLDTIAKRRYGHSDLAKQTEILVSLEKEYDDFSLVVPHLMPTRRREILSMPIREVADTSRCITFTEMLSLKMLPQVVNDYYPDKTERNRFKQKLCDHMVYNVANITTEHNKLTENVKENIKMDHQDTKKSTLLTVLNTIKDMILDTKWTLGWAGGDPIKDKDGKLINTVPRGMATILTTINKCLSNIAMDVDLLIKTLQELANSAVRSAKHPGLSFFGFGKRDKHTQRKYEDIKDSICYQLRQLN